MISSTISNLPVENGEFIERPLFSLNNLRYRGRLPLLPLSKGGGLPPPLLPMPEIKKLYEENMYV